MNISAQDEYGLRCILAVAGQPVDTPISASTLAEREGLSTEYVSKILLFFRRAGLVRAQRGKQGGFILSRSPSQISLQQVFGALHAKRAQKFEQSEKEFCGKFSGQQKKCVHLEGCSVRPVWDVVLSYFKTLTAQVSLADLMVSEEEARFRLSRLAETRVQEVLQVLKAPGLTPDPSFSVSADFSTSKRGILL